MSIATEIQRLQTAKINIKTAIENKGVTVGDGTIDTYAEKISEISSGGGGDYDQGYEDGKNSVIQVDKAAKTYTIQSLNLLGKEEVTLNLDNVTSLNSLAYMSTVEDENTTVKHLTINCLQPITNVSRVIVAHSRDDVLERVTFNVDISKATTTAYFLSRLYALKVVDGIPLDFSSANSISTTAFHLLPALEEIRFAKNSIHASITFSGLQLLSANTIQSIIDGLADLTGGTAQTLTLHATVGAKLTDEQKVTITAKNWTLVY